MDTQPTRVHTEHALSAAQSTSHQHGVPEAAPCATHSILIFQASLFKGIEGVRAQNLGPPKRTQHAHRKIPDEAIAFREGW